MYFFIFIFLLFSFSYEASLKRKQDDEVDLEIVQDENLKRARSNEDILIIYKKGFDSVSSDLIFYIGSFLNNPYGTLSPVSKFLNDSLNKNGSSPQILLNSRTTYQNLLRVPKFSTDLNRLLIVKNIFINERFRDLLYPGSLYKPANPETVEYAVKFILEKFQNQNNLKNLAIENMTKNLITTKNHSSLLRLIRLQPTISLNLIIGNELTELVWTAFKSDLIHLNNLKKSSIDFNALPLFTTIASTPIPLIEFKKITENIDPELAADMIAVSCSLLTDDVFILSEVENQLIYERNIQFLGSLSHSQALNILVKWAKLCNDLKHSKILDVPISQDFFRDLTQFALLKSYNNQSIAQIFVKHYHDYLIICAVLGNYKNIFKQILKMNQFNRSSRKFKNTLLKFPEFMNLLSLTNFKRTFGKKDQVLLIKNHYSLENILAIHNVYQKLRVISEFFSIEYFGNNLRIIHEAKHFSLPKLIMIIIKSDSKRIVPIVNTILEYGLTVNLDKLELKMMGNYLGNPKYIKELLEPENLQFLLQPANLKFKEFYIIINGENFTEIQKLSGKLKGDSAKNLRNRLRIAWTDLFKKASIFPDQLIELFSIFGIKIGDFSEIFGSLEVFLNPHLIFDYPELYQNQVDKFLIYLALNIHHEESLHPSQWVTSNLTNPMLYRAYGIFQLWMDSNLGTFLTKAPVEIINAFNPIASKEFIKSAILNAKNNETLVIRLFAHVIPKNTTIHIEINSVSDLRLFFNESIPIVFVYNLDVKVSWLQLIESSRTYGDFEIILSIITKEEIDSISQVEIEISKLHKYNLFFEYLNRNLNQRIFPKTNRRYIMN